MAIAAAVSGRLVRALWPVESGGRRKVTERLVTDLQRKRKDFRAVEGGLRRTSSHSKAVQIRVLQLLVDERDWELAVPMYHLLRKNSWYIWNPSLHASLVALLASAGRYEDTQTSLLEPPGCLTTREKMRLQAWLIEKYAEVGLLDMVMATFEELHALSLPGARRLGHRAVLRAYIAMRLLHKADSAWRQMKSEGFGPCLDDYKALLRMYGNGGRISDMETLLHEIEEAGLRLDRSGFNVMLSAYAQAERFGRVVETLERMGASGISCNINSRNAISKHCPAMISAFKALQEWPKSVSALCSLLEREGIAHGELQMVEALLDLGLHSDCVKWEQDVWELDVHDMFLGTANIALFLWLHQVQECCKDGVTLPPVLKVVTGWGKHSDVEGVSTVRNFMHELLTRTKSPFRFNSQNKGTLVSRGSSLKVWLT